MRFVIILTLLALTGVNQAADTPEDRFFNAADLARQAELAVSKSDWSLAGEKFTAALAILRQIRADYPTWNEQVVDFRIRAYTQQLAELNVIAPNPTPPPPDPRLEQLTADLATAQTRIAELDTVRAGLTDKLQQLETRAGSSAQELAELRAVRDQTAVLTATNQLLATRLTALQTELAELRNQADLKREVATSAVAELAAVRAEKDHLATATQTLQTQLAALADQSTQLSNRLATAQTELTTLRDQAAKTTDRRRALLEAAAGE